MSLRGFGIQSATTTPAPLYGTQLTAAVKPIPDSSRGVLAPGFADSVATLSITAGTTPLLRYGDHVMVGASDSWSQGSNVAPDGGRVIAVDSAANTIKVQGLLRAHASGEFVVLAMPCAQIPIQVLSSGGSGTFYVGEDNTVGPASSYLIAEISAGGTQNIGFPAVGNVLETQKLWVSSSASNSYLAPMLTI